jgi:acyl-CoA synthetase (AMP-forming)/AMP-acid ligase II
MSWTDWLGDLARQHANHIAVIDAKSGRRHSFRAFDNRANQIAHFCEQWVGLQAGDGIGLLSTPSDDVLQIVIAANKLGLSAQILNPDAASEDLISEINSHGPRTVFHGLAQADLVQEIWFEVDSVEHFIPLRGAVDTANFEDIVAHYPPSPPPRPEQENLPWVRFPTDGITWMDERDVAAGLTPDEKLGSITTPLFHSAGLAAAVQGLRSGRCVVVKTDTVQIIESPAEISPDEEEGTAYQRNVPRGRSWLPHEFL